MEKPDFSTKSILKEAIDYGEEIKREIIFDKKNKNKGLDNENDILRSNYLYKNMEDIAINNPTEGELLFVLCLLSKILKDKGIETAIYKDKNNIICDDSIINILCCEVLYKYDFIFDFCEEQNKKILNGKIEYENLCKSMKKILSKKLNIDENKILFSVPKKGSAKISVAFITPGIYQKEELISELKDVKELEKLKDIHKTVLMEGCKLTKDIFDQKGNNKDPTWGENETRGGENYIPPIGWYGYGLNVENKFDDGNNNWLGYMNDEDEYAIAYYPIRNFHEDPKEMKKLINSISNLNIIDNKSDPFYSIFEKEDNINTGNILQEKCGTGIYFYQDINIAEKQASIIDINGIRYKILIMCRVNPKKIRIPESCPFIWILNPDTFEIRQYRILIKIEALKPIADQTFKVETKPSELYRDIIDKKDVSFFDSQIVRNVMEEKNMNKHEAIAHIYTTEDYKVFNKYLLFKEVDEESGYTEKDIKSFIWCLHSTLINYYKDVHSDKLETIKDGETVYRKTDKTFDFEKYGKGSQFYLANFISTSKNTNYTGIYRMNIKIRNNEKNNYCYYIKNISDIPGEEEVLISPFTSFIITNITENNDGNKIVDLECIGYVLDDNKIKEWPK